MIDQAEQDRQARVNYDAAVASRTPDSIELELEAMRTVHRSLAPLDAKTRERVLAYLKSAYAERLN